MTQWEFYNVLWLILRFSFNKFTVKIKIGRRNYKEKGMGKDFEDSGRYW